MNPKKGTTIEPLGKYHLLKAMISPRYLCPLQRAILHATFLYPLWSARLEHVKVC